MQLLLHALLTKDFSLFLASIEALYHATTTNMYAFTTCLIAIVITGIYFFVLFPFQEKNKHTKHPRRIVELVIQLFIIFTLWAMLFFSLFNDNMYAFTTYLIAIALTGIYFFVLLPVQIKMNILQDDPPSIREFVIIEFVIQLFVIFTVWAVLFFSLLENKTLVTVLLTILSWTVIAYAIFMAFVLTLSRSTDVITTEKPRSSLIILEAIVFYLILFVLFFLHSNESYILILFVFIFNELGF